MVSTRPSSLPSAALIALRTSRSLNLLPRQSAFLTCRMARSRAIARSAVDDQSAHVVLDRLGHRFTVLAEAFGERIYRRLPALDDELHQRQIVEGRELLALLRPDVGVEQVAHGRLVHLHVDVVTAG